MDYIDRRLSEGLENCVVLLRELESLGYQGGYSLVKKYVSPRRRGYYVPATVRFETEPGDRPRWTGAVSATWMRRATSAVSGLS